MRKALALLLLFVPFIGLPIAHAQSTIFVTRHADRFGTEPDPSLTPKGKAQAQALAQLLSDANIRHIFTTELLRTQQTAAPLAHIAKIAPVSVPQHNFNELIDKVRAVLRPNESVLVVGHRATVPKIVRALTGKDIRPMGSSEYGRLIVITLFPDGKSSVITPRYAPSL
ncbi:MAG TPA: histidine phosphatase family protein [Terracidiphilus sp.]|nr:histidine phosphatase family protein [Terracidiphilus sp.]